MIMNSQEFNSSIFTRGKSQWLSEWAGHNALYEANILRDHTGSVDLNELELFAVNLSFIAFFLVTDIPKYTTIIILFLPIIADILISEKLFHKMTQKQKSGIYLNLSVISILANTLFGIYEYYFGFMDVVGMFVLFLYTVIFNVLPCLIIALIYFINQKLKKK